MDVVELQPGQTGIDYAYARPGIAEIQQHGWTFVARYLSTNKSKVLTVAERDALHEAGIAILLVWEQSEVRPLQGEPAGRVDGTMAAAMATALGYPVDCPVFAALDFDTYKPDEINKANAYMVGFSIGLGRFRVGCYSGTHLIDRAAGVLYGRTVYGWQANASSWSPHESVNVYAKQGPQSPDGRYDTDVIVRPLNAWLPHDITTTQKDTEMANLIRVTTPQADAAVLCQWPDGTCSWVPSQKHIDMLIANGVVAASATPVRGVDRSYLKMFGWVGQLPDYTGVDPTAWPGRTVASDFRL